MAGETAGRTKMDDATRIKNLREAVNLLLPLAKFWQQDAENKVGINPARAAVAANAKAAIEKAKVLSEIDE